MVADGIGVREGGTRGVAVRVGVFAGGTVLVGGTVGGIRVNVGRATVRVIVHVAVGLACAIRSPVRQPSTTSQKIPDAATTLAGDNRFNET